MVAIDRKNEINNLAIEILENVDMLDKVPVDIIKIANNLGLKVYNCTFDKQGTCGAIIKENDEYSIYVKTDDARVRQRFTVAHEIGHFVLHKNLLDDAHYDDILFRGNMTGIQEEEANYFASCILMNEEPLLKIYKVLRDNKALSKIFEVSEAAMNIRMQGIKR